MTLHQTRHAYLKNFLSVIAMYLLKYLDTTPGSFLFWREQVRQVRRTVPLLTAAILDRDKTRKNGDKFKLSLLQPKLQPLFNVIGGKDLAKISFPEAAILLVSEGDTIFVSKYNVFGQYKPVQRMTKGTPGDEVERPWERVCPCNFSEVLFGGLFIYLFMMFTKKDIPQVV